jgi:hypothetical protein
MVKVTLSNYKASYKTLRPLISFLLIGLDKPVVRAKGINHPKYSVEAEYACLKRESATS